jgi:hypothetical protein
MSNVCNISIKVLRIKNV